MAHSTRKSASKHGRNNLTRNQRRKAEYAALRNKGHVTVQTTAGAVVATRGGNARNHRTKFPLKQFRRESAARCAEARAKRTVQEQLDLIKTRPGQSLKETNRLTRLLSA